jgi:hypothetical protein
VLASVFVLACNSGSTDASTEGGPSDAAPVFDLCDAFTEVGASCPAASSILCFPLCEAGGCSCELTSAGPRWACVTDLSCVAPCAPIDAFEDACAPDADSSE